MSAPLPANTTASTTTEALPGPSLEELIEATNQTARPDTFDSLAQARIMARDGFLPQHLRFALDPERTVANCFRIVAKAKQWKMSPYDLAGHTYEKGGKLHYDGIVTAAVVQNSGKIVGRLTFTHTGSGAGLQGKVSGTLKGCKDPVSVDVVPWTGPTRSTSWDTDPVQMLWYRGARQWARLYLPEIFFSIDGGEDQAEPIRAEDLVKVQAELPRAASREQIDECRNVSGLIGWGSEVEGAELRRRYSVGMPEHLSYTQATDWITVLRSRLATSRENGQLTSPPPAPPAPTADPLKLCDSSTLQEGMAAHLAAVAAADAARPVSEGQVLADLASVRDSYFAGLGGCLTEEGELTTKGRQLWIAMLGKRGLPGSAIPPLDVAQEMVATLTAAVEARRQGIQNSCVASAAAGGPASVPAGKS